MKVLRPVKIRVPGGHEMVFHPATALARLTLENERLAQELWHLEKSRLFVPRPVRRAKVALHDKWKYNALKAQRDRYRNDPALRARKASQAKARYHALKAAAQPRQERTEA